MNSDINEKFYQDGFVNLQYSNINTIDAFNNRIQNLISEDEKWKTKYKQTKDFKFEFLKDEDIFYDFLFKNNFHNLINSISSKELFLTNIQLRVCYKGLSYMTWHRDTYLQNNKIIGPFKPCFKLMVYPDLYGISSREISLIPSSHNRLNFNLFHKYLSSLSLKTKHVNNNNNSCLLIDTTILHKAVSSLKNIARPRIIFNFSTEDTMKRFYKSDLNLHYISKYKKYLN